MHTIKFRGCLAQQNNNTFEVIVSKAGHPSLTYHHNEKFSGKELRSIVARYLIEVGIKGGD
jgi:hypothetical protein